MRVGRGVVARVDRGAVARVGRGVAGFLSYLAYALGWAVVRRLREGSADRLFDVLADLSWRRRGSGVRRLETNLRRVLGAGPGTPVPPARLRALSRAGMRSYLRYWCDVFRLPDWDRDRVVGPVQVSGEQHLRNALRARRGFLGALPHLGNWDHVGAWACLTGAPVTTVAERLRPERLYERFVAFRERLGMEVLPVSDGGDLLATLADRLRANRAVCLLADRDLRAAGVEVRFFGEAARMPPGPALLALRTGAPLHPVTVTYPPDRDPRAGIVVTIHDRLEPPVGGTTRERVTALTQALATVFESAIAAAPQDWHMLQPRWSADVGRHAGTVAGRDAAAGIAGKP